MGEADVDGLFIAATWLFPVAFAAKTSSSCMM